MIGSSSPCYSNSHLWEKITVCFLMMASSAMAFSPIYTPSQLNQLNQQQQRSTIDQHLVGRSSLLVPPPAITTTTTTTELAMIFNKKKKQDDDDDLSYIETRDMTREEMAQYNQQFEDTVNQEIVGMTVFSLIISLPLLYLAWVAFFADTAEIAGEL
jgi:hypothetical protein